MNLADAIRRAAQGAPPDDTESSVPMPEILLEAQSRKDPPETEPGPMPVMQQTETTPVADPPKPDPYEKPVVVADAKSVNQGGAVRLELLLTPEQLANLLRGAVANHHSMLTIRETASYLRLNSAKVQAMAASGELPGVMIDGRWRFLKTKLDEWIDMRANKPGGEGNAA